MQRQIHISLSMRHQVNNDDPKVHGGILVSNSFKQNILYRESLLYWYLMGILFLNLLLLNLNIDHNVEIVF